MEGVWRFGHITNSDLRRAEWSVPAKIKDDLGKGEEGRKPSEVIVSGNALFYFRSYGQEENLAEM